jgi:hypothetical protein
MVAYPNLYFGGMGSGSFRLASGAPKELSVDLRRLTRRMVCVLGFSE